MQSLLRDLRYGLRTLRKSPGLTLVAVFALTIGIGLTTMMFSIVYGALLRGLPFPDGDRFVVLERANPSRGIRQQNLPIQDFVDYRAQQHAFTALGASTSGTMNVSGASSGAERAQRVDGSWVSAEMLSMTGIRPALGRTFRAGEDVPGGPHVAVIGWSLWKTRYAGDPGILGRDIRVNGTPFTVIGVMPDGFAFPQNDQLWLPLQVDPMATKRGEGQFVGVVGKLKPGVSMDRAQVEMSTIARRLATEYKESNEGFDARVRGFVDSQIGPQPKQLLYTMLGAVFLVLIIACANVANLLLDRAAHRTKEVGIRTALGASRGAVVRQFLAEALVLCAASAVLGVGVSHAGIVLFRRAIADTQVPFFIDIRLWPPVLAFTVGVAFLAALFAGAIPAIQSSRTDINEVLRDESRGSSGLHIGRISRALVMFEIALSCGLLVAAGLMIKSVAKMRNMDPGFSTHDVFTARVGFPAEYTDTVAQARFFEQLAQRVGALSGVQAASISSGLPAAQQSGGGGRFAIEGKSYAKDADYPNTRTLEATPGFFPTLGIGAAQGRLFTDADRDGSLPVAVVSRTFVRKYFPSADPIGQRIRLGGAKSTAPWLTIVGVIPDVFDGDPDDPFPALVIRPFAQAFGRFAYISARTTGAPMALTTPVRDAVASLDPDIPLYWVMPLDEAIAQPLWFVRVFGTMFMIFGLIALVLAAIGLYAVMSFSVSRRTREVGIRMAIGAQRGDVVGLIFRQGLVQLVIGMTAGLLFALGVSRLMSVILFDVPPRDPTIFGGVAAVLVATGLLACLIPARRATRIEPIIALRAE